MLETKTIQKSDNSTQIKVEEREAGQIYKIEIDTISENGIPSGRPISDFYIQRPNSVENITLPDQPEPSSLRITWDKPDGIVTNYSVRWKQEDLDYWDSVHGANKSLG